MAKTNQNAAEFADDLRVIGVYPDLTPETGSSFAEDIEQTLLYEDLIEQGYQVMGVIDKDSTEEDIQNIAKKIADKSVPGEDSPVWSALAEEYLSQMPLKFRVEHYLDADERDAWREEVAKHEEIGDAEQFVFDRFQEIMRGIE